MSIPIDILGLGSVAVDDLLYVAKYPQQDTKERVLRRERQCGGLTGTAMVAAAKSGARSSYAGVIGTDELSDVVVRQFERVGVDVSWLARDAAARVIYSVIVVDEGRQTRNIFYDLAGALGVRPEWPPEEAIRSARVVFVDHLDPPRMLRGARIARAATIPVVADFEYVSGPQFEELMSLVDHLIIPSYFAGTLTGKSDPGEQALALWRPDRSLVAVTCGADGSWWVDGAAPGSAHHQPAFEVAAIDTTGCGDVFHGAYAAALVRGLATAERMRYASAAAALKATMPGGQSGIPTRERVETLLMSASTHP